VGPAWSRRPDVAGLLRRARRPQASIRAISIDINGGYEKAIRAAAAADGRFDPEVCFDPFHVVQVRHEALPVRVGCETPPPGCRGSPLKLRAA
jgi:Transposase